jgi:hypothetical protein
MSEIGPQGWDTAKRSQIIIRRQNSQTVISESEKISQAIEIQVQRIHPLWRDWRWEEELMIVMGTPMRIFQRQKVRENMSRGIWRREQRRKAIAVVNRQQGRPKERPQNRFKENWFRDKKIKRKR